MPRQRQSGRPSEADANGNQQIDYYEFMATWFLFGTLLQFPVSPSADYRLL